MKNGCKVYKRAGITHVCYKGLHYAPPKDTNSVIDREQRVVLSRSELPEYVIVTQGATQEAWVKTVIGDDNPSGYATKKGTEKSPKKVKEPKKEKAPKNSGTVLKLLTPELRASMNLPSDEDVDKMIVLTAPKDAALDILRVCWANWLRVTEVNNRNLVPFAGLNYADEEATSKIHDLGAALAILFNGVYVR
jgi:hypothetical protein